MIQFSRVLDFIIYSHLTMTFWKRRNVVPCFITFYRKILLLNVLRNLYLFELAYSSIKDFGRLVTTIFLLMKHLHCRFSTFREKSEENLWTTSLNLLQNAPSNFILFGSSFICDITSCMIKCLLKDSVF